MSNSNFSHLLKMVDSHYHQIQAEHQDEVTSLLGNIQTLKSRIEHLESERTELLSKNADLVCHIKKTE